MKKAVLISVRPKWVELIASGRKTAEVRKNRPQIETPFICYLYMSRYHWAFDLLRNYGMEELADRLAAETGMVVGEFICDSIYKFSTVVYLGNEQLISDDEVVKKSCVPRSDLRKYEGTIAPYGLYGWNISGLKIYEKPKRIFDFVRPACERASDCGAGCSYWCGSLHRCMRNYIVLTPPQSWMYVEELP